MAEGTGLLVGPDLEIRLVAPTDLREQDVNAQVMEPAQFERLTANIKERGQLESLPYCSQPNSNGPIAIVSGHHRVRAAVAAGLEQIPVLVDTGPMTRSRVVAKQIAHNVLHGTQDDEVLRRMVSLIDEVDDLLTTGLPDDYLPIVDDDVPSLGSEPTAAFEWKSVTFTFLPHQFDRFDELARALDNVDAMAVADRDQYEAFAEAVHRYGLAHTIRSSGTVVATLVEIAHRELAALEAEAEHSGGEH